MSWHKSGYFTFILVIFRREGCRKFKLLGSAVPWQIQAGNEAVPLDPGWQTPYQMAFA
jgi:hypothetical protein